jgi:hypothetical protein
MSEELANAFATGECLLRHGGLSFRRRQGRAFRSATAIAPGLNFETLRNLELKCQDLSPESARQTFKTQNDARGA